jgi:hypothetical protein
MKHRFLCPALVWVLLSGSPAVAQSPEGGDIEALRQEIQALRADYEARIADLETRLDAAEQAAAAKPQQQKPAVAVAGPAADYAEPPMLSPQTVSVARDRSFNPSIGVTFQGQAWSFSNDPDAYQIPGFPLGGEAGPAPEGLALAETEISMSANVDDKFTAMLNAPIVVEDGEVGIELEEAWVETVGLPASLSLRMGRFYSGIGYLNSRHAHTWDFADQPLAYQAFLGNQYFDDGLQARWLAPTDFYLEFSAELLRGDRYPAGGAANSGFGAQTVSLKTGGDVGFSNSWLAGLSWLGADADGRLSGREDEPLWFTGTTDMLIANLVWKWAPNGNSRQRNFIFAAEYLWRNEDGDYGPAGDAGMPWDVDQSGWYAQAVYQPFPRWRFGARYDRLSGDTPDQRWLETPLYPLGSDPRRYSLMVDWSNSEFSRLRLQYNYDEASDHADNQFALQYIFSIGAHGAHTF